MHICERKRGAQSWGDILFLTGLYEVDTGWCQVVPGGTRLYKVVPGDTTGCPRKKCVLKILGILGQAQKGPE